MSPLAVFFRTLSRSTAICLGVGFAVVNPSFDWSPGRTNALTTEPRMTGVTAQNSPSERAVVPAALPRIATLCGGVWRGTANGSTSSSSQ